jgi:hypothetical protein
VRESSPAGPRPSGVPTIGSCVHGIRVPQPSTVENMTRSVRLVVGVVVLLLGVLWTLQGLDVLGGSGMSGKTVWAIVGPIVALAGAYVAFRAWRMPPARDDL